jgi:hypothetical protein
MEKPTDSKYLHSNNQTPVLVTWKIQLGNRGPGELPRLKKMGYPEFWFMFGSWGWVQFQLGSEYPEPELDPGTLIFQVPGQHQLINK